MSGWQIDPRKEPRRLSALIIGGSVIGGMYGSDIFRWVYQLFGWSYPGG